MTHIWDKQKPGQNKFKISTVCYAEQEFNRIVLCHQLWLKTEADEIRKDITYARDKNS